jgi:hypothetical protein
MSVALSPNVQSTTSDSSRAEGPLTNKEFAHKIKYLQTAVKNLVQLTSHVYRLPANTALRLDDKIINRSDIKEYTESLISQLGERTKDYSSRKKRSPRNNDRLNALFFVGKQLMDFYTGANLGPVDLDSPKGKKLAKDIELVTKHGMATSGILTSLLSRYISVNGLKSKAVGGRFLPDDRMKKYFDNCEYNLFGKVINDREINPQTPPDRIEKVQDHIANSKKSAFELFGNRIDPKTKELVYDEEKGVAYTGTMMLNNRFRIPNCMITPDEKLELLDEDRVADAKRLQKLLTFIKKQKTDAK